MRFIKPIIIISLLAFGLGTQVSPASAQFGDFRPDLANEEQFGSEHFLVHYTRSGDDAIVADDADANGTPDYVEAVSAALESNWNSQINLYGWATPPSDGDIGGDARIDVYLIDIMPDGIAGYVETDSESGGDNPNTPERERRASAAFMALDNDYLEVLEDIDDPDGPEKLMLATVAHEFNHILQAGYDNLDQHDWLYESTASWMEDEIYDDINDNVYYIYDRFSDPSLCMVSDVTWYGNWLFLRLLSEQRGHQVVRSIWEHSRTLDGFAAIDAAIGDPNYTLVNAAADFSIANLLRAYEEGAAYPTVLLTESLELESYSPLNGVQSLGADYYEITAPGQIIISMQDTEPFMQLIVVGVDGSSADVFGLNDDPQVIIDTDTYDYVYAIVFNRSQALPSENCTYIDYTLDISQPGQAENSPSRRTINAVNFTPPGFVTEQPDDGYIPPSGAPFRSAEDELAPDELDVPFQTIIPTRLPEDYTFDYAYIMDEEDFSGIEDYYIPGGGVAANFDYLTKDGDWLSIAQSISPYTTIQEWLDDVDYDTPGDLIDISGTTVLLEDLSEVDSPWFSLTLIIDDLFIVIDGDENEQVVVELAEILIAAPEPDAPAEDQPDEAEGIPQDPADEGPEPTSVTYFEELGEGNQPPPISIRTIVIAMCVGLLCLILVLGGTVVAIVLGRRRRPDV